MPTLLIIVATALQVQHPARLPPLVGLYALADGSALIVWSPADGQLAFAYGDGQVRGLSGGSDVLSYGPSLGVTTPAAGTIRPFARGDRVDSVAWQPIGASVVIARRVALREDEVRFEGAGVTLSGTIIAPSGTAPAPGIVFLHGSAPETRESSRVLAYLLAHHGVASLIFDKRSTGRSTGQSHNAPFSDLAVDATAALALLRHDPRIRADHVGFYGPSQGSWVAIAATTRPNPPDFLILQSGDAATPLDMETARGELLLRTRTSLSDTEIRDAIAFRRLKFMYAITGRNKSDYARALAQARGTAWFQNIGAALPDTLFWKPNGLYDPTTAMAAYRGPVLAMFGARDTSKDAATTADAVRTAFERGGNGDVTVTVFPNANHGLFETTTGLPLERELPSLSRMAPGYVDTLTAWLRVHAR